MVSSKERRTLINSTLHQWSQDIKTKTFDEVLEKWPFLREIEGIILCFKCISGLKKLDHLDKRFKRLLNGLSAQTAVETLEAVLKKSGDGGPLVYDDSQDEMPSYPIIMKNEGPYLWVRIENQDLYKTDSAKQVLYCWAFTFEVFGFQIPECLMGLATKFI